MIKNTVINDTFYATTFHLVIVSGYPRGYSQGETCEWTFRAPSGSRLVVDFLHMDMDKSECYSNRVTVYDGEGKAFLKLICVVPSLFVN